MQRRRCEACSKTYVVRGRLFASQRPFSSRSHPRRPRLRSQPASQPNSRSLGRLKQHIGALAGRISLLERNAVGPQNSDSDQPQPRIAQVPVDGDPEPSLLSLQRDVRHLNSVLRANQTLLSRLWKKTKIQPIPVNDFDVEEKDRFMRVSAFAELEKETNRRMVDLEVRLELKLKEQFQQAQRDREGAMPEFRSEDFESLRKFVRKEVSSSEIRLRRYLGSYFEKLGKIVLERIRDIRNELVGGENETSRRKRRLKELYRELAQLELGEIHERRRSGESSDQESDEFE